MIRRPPRSTRVRSSAASDVYKRQDLSDRTGADAETKRVSGVSAVRTRHNRTLQSRGRRPVTAGRLAVLSQTLSRIGKTPGERAHGFWGSRNLALHEGADSVVQLRC